MKGQNESSDILKLSWVEHSFIPENGSRSAAYLQRITHNMLKPLLLMQEGVHGPLPSENLEPICSLDSQAIRYHLLPAPLMHKFRGPRVGASAGYSPPGGMLPQTPPPEKVKEVTPRTPVKKGGGKGKKGPKPKKKKKGLKRAPKDGEDIKGRPSSLLPTVESYWGPLVGAPHRPSPEAPITRGEGSEESEEETAGCLSGVCCLDANRTQWLSERSLSSLLFGVARGLRCLSLAGCEVGDEAQKGLSACCKCVLSNKRCTRLLGR